MMDLLTVVLSLILVAISAQLLFGKDDPNAPPCIKGWIPWFGAAFEFGKAPLNFIVEARRKYGAVFTVLAAGKRLTFITLHEDFRTFFMSKDVDFEQAVQEPVHHTASISKDSFYSFHSACNTMIKGRLSPGNVTQLQAQLCDEFNHNLELLGPRGNADLNKLVREVMYPAVMSNLLGKNNSPGWPFTMEEFQQRFSVYDEGFEYGSQLPDLLLREWAVSKRWLLSLLGNMVVNSEDTEESEHGGRTLLQHLVTTITDKYLPNYGLLMLWASLANAIPITFWAIAFMLSKPHIYQTAMDEINLALKNQDRTSPSVGPEQLQQMPYVKWVILEAIRLRSPGAIARRVVRPLRIQNFVVPAGDLLMLSPYWAHRDPRYFPEPDQFRPERWEKADLVKNVFLEGFVAFGGGRNQCPGRWYAIVELHMFVAMILYKYNFTLMDPLPEPVSLISPIYRVLYTWWGPSSQQDHVEFSTNIASPPPTQGHPYTHYAALGACYKVAGDQDAD